MTHLPLGPICSPDDDIPTQILALSRFLHEHAYEQYAIFLQQNHVAYITLLQQHYGKMALVSTQELRDATKMLEHLKELLRAMAPMYAFFGVDCWYPQHSDQQMYGFWPDIVALGGLNLPDEVGLKLPDGTIVDREENLLPRYVLERHDTGSGMTLYELDTILTPLWSIK